MHVFEGDGSVVINHYGCEVGQGIHTKVSRTHVTAMSQAAWSSIITAARSGRASTPRSAGGPHSGTLTISCLLAWLLSQVAQAAAYQLGVPLDLITVTPTTTDKVRHSAGWPANL